MNIGVYIERQSLMEGAMSKSTASSSGIGFTGLLTIVFIILKLCKVIDWSWLWVLSPLWISGVIGILILAVIGLIFMVVKAE